MRDLHALTRSEGIDAIANVIRVSARALRDIRRGWHPLTVDHLYALKNRFPDFDSAATIDRLGFDRIIKRRAQHLLRDHE